MSREIKFRAWSTHGEGAMFFVGDKHGTTHPLDCCAYAIQGQPVELMQWTGLQDRNGVDIYEGDIVKSHYNKSFYPITIEEIPIGDHDGDEAGYSEGFVWDGLFFGRDYVGGTSQYEVIGNIHQNPELLEVKS